MKPSFPSLAATLAILLAGAACTNNADGGVVVFDENYTAETIGTISGVPSSPDGLAWHEGSLYVADEGGSAVRKLGPRGWETLADASSGIMSPEDIVVDADGRIFFTDDSAGGLWTVTDGGAKLVTEAGFGNTPTEGLGIASSGQLLVGNARSRRVGVVDPAAGGPPGDLASFEIGKPESIAVGSDGTTWVADNEADLLYKFAPGAPGPIKLSWPGVSPESIALAGQTLWMTDSYNGKVYRLQGNERLETVALLAGKLNNVSGITSDPAGSIYVSIQTDLKAREGTIVALRNRR